MVMVMTVVFGKQAMKRYEYKISLISTIIKKL